MGILYMADERKEAAVSLLRSYLNKRMRVVISDGRVVDGNFLCTDKDRNMVLGNCEEYSSARELGKCVMITSSSATYRDHFFAAEVESSPGSKFYQPRTLGLAIVPGCHVQSIAIAKDSTAPSLAHPDPTPSPPQAPPSPPPSTSPPQASPSPSPSSPTPQS